MAKSERNLTAIFQDTADAIRAKTGGTDEINPRDFADEIESISSGEIVPGPNDNVVVYDYDGTVLDAQQVAVGEEYTLPAGPTHDRLTFDGWSCNCQVTNGKVTIPDTKEVRIGALYYSTSGHLEGDIEIQKGLVLTLQNYTGQVDWGDGTTDSNLTHTYSASGEYTISLLGNITQVPGYSFVADNSKQFFKRIRLPKSITSFGAQAVYNFANLESINIPNNAVTFNNGNAIAGNALLKIIIIPNGTTTIETSNMFNSNYFVKDIVIPQSLNNLGNANTFIAQASIKKIVLGVNNLSTLGYGVFYGCKQAKEIVLSKSISRLSGNVFYECRSLEKIVFNSNVTRIDSSNNFEKCCNVSVIDFSNNTEVPTLNSSANFDGMNSAYKIVVPDSLYESWIAASNWSNVASHIVKASEA